MVKYIPGTICFMYTIGPINYSPPFNGLDFLSAFSHERVDE